MKKNFLIVGNNKGICQNLKKKIFEVVDSVEVLILPGGHLINNIEHITESAQGKDILLAFKNSELKEITELLNQQGLTNLFVCPWDTHYDRSNTDLDSLIIQIDNSKPRLDYLEVEVSESCNLNCKGCNEFSNLVEENKFVDIQETKRDLKKLKDLFWGVGKIRLMGGEPLVNPDYFRFVIMARELFPDSDIRVLTNGLLIPKLKKDDLIEIKNSNCSFDISNYPPTQKIIDAITGCLNEAGIPYNLSMPNKLFFKSLLSEPLESSKEAFNNCLFTHCHAVSGGYLSACSNQMYAYRLNKAFNLHFPDNDKIDIHNTKLTGWEINEIFAKPHEFCRYCGRGMVPYKWKVSPKGSEKAKDWLIEPKFLNMKVMPIVQRSMKSFANQLRYIRQRPKKNRYD